MFGDPVMHFNDMLRDIREDRERRIARQQAVRAIDEADAEGVGWASRYYFLLATIKKISASYEIPDDLDPYEPSRDYYLYSNGNDLWEKATDIGYYRGKQAPLPPELQAAVDAKERVAELEKEVAYLRAALAERDKKIASLQIEVAARDKALEKIREINESNLEEMAGVVAARYVMRKALNIVWPDHPLVKDNEAIRLLHSQAKRAHRHDTGNAFDLAKQAGEFFIIEHDLEKKARQVRDRIGTAGEEKQTSEYSQPADQRDGNVSPAATS